MTPTLIGRWQTRVVLLWTVGLAVTFVYMQRFGAFDAAASDPGRWKLPMILGYVTLLGLAWDCLFTYLQSYRWDRDWPLAYQFLAGLAEGSLVFTLFRMDLLPGARYGSEEWWQFMSHYGTVWLTIYLCQLGPMRVVLPRWRFAGAEITHPFSTKPTPAHPGPPKITRPEEDTEKEPEEIGEPTESETPTPALPVAKEHHEALSR